MLLLSAFFVVLYGQTLDQVFSAQDNLLKQTRERVLELYESAIACNTTLDCSACQLSSCLSDLRLANITCMDLGTLP